MLPITMEGLTEGDERDSLTMSSRNPNSQTKPILQELASPTGDYKLRVKGGKEYLVTRKYKCNLRDLAQLWVGAEWLCC